MTGVVKARIALICTAFFTLAGSPTSAKELDPPAVKRQATTRTVHGVKLVDDYAWLRGRNKPEVLAHLTKENAYAESILQAQRDLENQANEKALEHIPPNDETAPSRIGDFFYVTRFQEGKEYPQIYRYPVGSNLTDARVLLDVNERYRGKKYVQLYRWHPSPSGRHFAYLIDTVGYREFDLCILDVQRGRLVKPCTPRVSSFAWGLDDEAVYAILDDPVTKRASRAVKVNVATGKSADIFYEKDEKYFLRLTRSRNGKFIQLRASSFEVSEVRLLDLSERGAVFRTFLSRKAALMYELEPSEDHLYLTINDKGPSPRLLRVPMRSWESSNWEEVLPSEDAEPIDRMMAFKNFLAVFKRREGMPALQILDMKSGAQGFVQFEHPAYSIQPVDNDHFESDAIRLEYSTPVTPKKTIDVAYRTRAVALVKPGASKMGFPESEYFLEVRKYEQPDGTRIPVIVAGRKSAQSGPRPMLLEGYGAYELALPIEFNPGLAPLLDKGMLWGLAQVRGGGEFGRRWYEAGKLANKKNTFSDFLRAVDGLQADGLTDKKSLSIMGISAGGLVIGTAANERPESFASIVGDVPFLDVLNSMLDPSLPLTTTDYLEWGNPSIKAQFEWIRAYSPYDNIRRAKYPPMLIFTALNDSQVPYWEGAKFVAKVRAHSTSNHPVILLTDMDSGHTGPSGRYRVLKQRIQLLVFAAYNSGIRASQPGR